MPPETPGGTSPGLTWPSSPAAATRERPTTWPPTRPSEPSLKEDLETRKRLRQEREKANRSAGEAVAFPGWEAVEQERREPEPVIWLIVRDAEGRVVRRLSGPTRAGFHRVAWDLRYPTPNAVELVEPPPPLWGEPPRGL